MLLLPANKIIRFHNIFHRKMRVLIVLFAVVFTNAKTQSYDDSSAVKTVEIHKYMPDWRDLDRRPLPKWYDEAKIGIFLHWGVYSVPGFGSEWFWANLHGGGAKQVDFMKKNYPPGFTYQEFAPMFKAEFFDPNKWADLFKAAGAKYIVLTSKHHEGFTLFPSKKSFSWNSVDIGPKRDLVGEVADAVRSKGLKFGVYHSLYEWFNPIYLQDKASNWSTSTYVDTKLWPDLKQLIHDYKPSVIWSDGDWEAYDDYWKSKEFLAWLYNDSPVRDEVVVNDRWGIGIPGKHGDFYNFADRFNNRTLQKHKWENAFTIDSTSWGYRRDININEVLTVAQLIDQIVTTVSCGGNALINVGPTKEGTICPIFQERLLSIGKWLTINGEAIYGTVPWKAQNDTYNGNVWYTCKKGNNTMRHEVKKTEAIYAITLKWPQDNILKMQVISPYLHSGLFQVELLGNEGHPLNWTITKGVAEIKLPDLALVKSEVAWALKFTMK